MTHGTQTHSTQQLQHGDWCVTARPASGFARSDWFVEATHIGGTVIRERVAARAGETPYRFAARVGCEVDEMMAYLRANGSATFV